MRRSAICVVALTVVSCGEDVLNKDQRQITLKPALALEADSTEDEIRTLIDEKKCAFQSNMSVHQSTYNGVYEGNITCHNKQSKNYSMDQRLEIAYQGNDEYFLLLRTIPTASYRTSYCDLGKARKINFLEFNVYSWKRASDHFSSSMSSSDQVRSILFYDSNRKAQLVKPNCPYLKDELVKLRN